MKTIITIILFTLISFHSEAKDSLSLNEAVNEVKAKGRVLSARTINGRHEIKILTPKGAVKTINKKAGKVNTSNRRKGSNEQHDRNAQKYQGSTSSKHPQANRNVMKLREQKSRSRRDAGLRGNQSNRPKVQTRQTRKTKSTSSQNKDN